MISFVGAGPGAADLLTLRAVDRLQHADVVLWAGSLVSADVLQHCAPDAERFDTKSMTLEQVTTVFEQHPNASIVRLHSGDPAFYSSITEQITWCLAHERCFEIVPGVSSVSAAAAAAGTELTVPGVSQSVVLTRLARRTVASLGAAENVASYAALGGLMAFFLSAGDPAALLAQLTGQGSAYTDETPAVIASRVSWPDEQIVHTTLGLMQNELSARNITMSALILVGDALAGLQSGGGGGDRAGRSHVYDPGFAHRYRDASTT